MIESPKCPLIKNYDKNPNTGEIVEVQQECMLTNCGWYMGEEYKCAVWVIAKAMTKVNEE
ncbi:hypothetical protein LCGC14_2693010 [marine sediment metagenome]|uniref:Uncharacterized protein n=1 Tax=marine sediment metagenome TaxID=412755 RepID=A0A0F9C9U1_9ZZZZ